MSVSAKQIQKLGYTCILETGAGLQSNFSDKDYKDAGVKIVKTATQLWKDSDIVLKVRGPEKSEIWSNVKAVWSTSHTAVAFGISGCAIIQNPKVKRNPSCELAHHRILNILSARQRVKQEE